MKLTIQKQCPQVVVRFIVLIAVCAAIFPVHTYAFNSCTRLNKAPRRSDPKP